MKKSLLTLAISGVIASFNAVASNEQTEQIIVTASRSNAENFALLAATQIFERSDIDNLKPESIAELLQQVAGIVTTTQGTAAHQTSLFVRGSNSDHVLVLIDGVRVGSATLGEKNLSELPVQLIERIEVVRGARAALWGSDAIGGVIQIFTRQLSHGQAQVGAQVGDNNFWQGYGAFGLGNEQHQLTISAAAEAANGYDIIVPAPNNIFAVNQPDKDGYDRRSLAINGTSQLSDHQQLSLIGQYQSGKTEIDASFSGDETHYDNYHLQLGSDWQLENSNAHLSVAQSKDANHDNFAELFAGAVDNQFETRRRQATANISFAVTENSELLAGIDWYGEKITSNNAYSETERNAIAYFITGRHQLESLSLEAAVRRDNIGELDGKNSYQLGLGFQANEQLFFALSKGTAFKAPTFNDLYWPEAFGSAGNPELNPETAENIELLSRFQSGQTAIELSLYQTDFDQLIEWAPLDVTNPFGGWQPTNIASAKIKGAELSLNSYFLDAQHRLTLSHTDAENEQTQQQLARRPYFSANYQLNYQRDQWQLTFAANYLGSRTDSNGQRLASRTLIDLTLNYDLTSQLALSAKVTNLADKKYQQISEYPGQDRGFRLGVDYQF